MVRKTPGRSDTVASFIARRIGEIAKTQKEIATELGYPHSNIITMIKKGDTPLPINKVGPMAKALQIEPGSLLRLVFAEYYPDTWAELGELLERILLTSDEIEMVNRSRAANRTSAAIRVVMQVAAGVWEVIRPTEALRMFNGEIPTPSKAGGMVKVVKLLGNATADKSTLPDRMQVDTWVVGADGYVAQAEVDRRIRAIVDPGQFAATELADEDRQLIAIALRGAAS